MSLCPLQNLWQLNEPLPPVFPLLTFVISHRTDNASRPSSSTSTYISSSRQFSISLSLAHKIYSELNRTIISISSITTFQSLKTRDAPIRCYISLNTSLFPYQHERPIHSTSTLHSPLSTLRMFTSYPLTK